MVFLAGAILGFVVSVIGLAGLLKPSIVAKRIKQGQLLGTTLPPQTVQPTRFYVKTTRIIFGFIFILGGVFLVWALSVPPAN